MKLYVKFFSKLAASVYNNGENLKYATSGSSGFDLRAVGVLDVENNKAVIDLSAGNFVLSPGKRCLVHAGIATKIAENFEIQVRPRSGLALNFGITIVNSPGTVDSDYRGEIGVILLNTSGENFEIKLGDRIAQAVICPVIKGIFEFVEHLDDTERAGGGFGSSGLN